MNHSRSRALLMGMGLLLCSLLPRNASADDVMLYKGESVTLTINSELGTLIEFPYPIQVVAESAQFSLEQVATQVTKNGSPVNVTLLKVKAKGSIRSAEKIPVVMTGHRTVTVRLVSTSGAPRHHRLLYPNRPSPFTSQGRFLEQETGLMRAMLRDESEGGFNRSVISQPLAIEGYDDQLEMTLVRRFEGAGLFGYTFQLRNKTREPVNLAPTTLNFGSPNQAVLLQVDSETLPPCHRSRSQQAGQGGCVTALRLVVRSERFVSPASASDLPFRLSEGGK